MPTLLVHLPSGIHAHRVTGDVILGRGSGCSIVVKQPGVSYQHAMLRCETIAGAPHWCVEDLNSKNGTRQNRKRIVGSVVLNESDRFALGKWPVDFKLADLTCAACHCLLDNGELVVICPDCGSPAHATCRAELNACPVLGCGQDREAPPAQPAEIDENLAGISPNARAYLAEDVDVIDERPAWAALGLSVLPGLLSFGVPVVILAMLVSRGSTKLRVIHSGRYESVALALVIASAAVSFFWWFGDLQNWLRGQGFEDDSLPL